MSARELTEAQRYPVNEGEYRIALRPDDHEADPDADGVLMDDIVVNDVPCFHAEDMGDWWWVCCYLDNDTFDRICWSVRARKKGVIEWTVSEWPNGSHVYEHDLPPRAVGESTPK